MGKIMSNQRVKLIPAGEAGKGALRLVKFCDYAAQNLTRFEEDAMPNPNHPAKGSIIRVDPIRDRKDIATIKRLLADKPRDLALFVVGINTALRVSDLLALTAGQVRPAEKGAPFDLEVREIKTGNLRRLTFNRAAVDALKGLLGARACQDGEKLFQGQRGPIGREHVNRLVKGWCRAVNLRGNYGSHTLRKTFGYQQRVSFGVDIPTLMTVYGHSSQKQTLTYLCIQPEEVANVYANAI